MIFKLQMIRLFQLTTGYLLRGKWSRIIANTRNKMQHQQIVTEYIDVPIKKHKRT